MAVIRGCLYTHVSDAHGTTSWLDHVLCSQDMQTKLHSIAILFYFYLFYLQNLYSALFTIQCALMCYNSSYIKHVNYTAYSMLYKNGIKVRFKLT